MVQEGIDHEGPRRHSVVKRKAKLIELLLKYFCGFFLVTILYLN